jgi:hypothetical protein
MSTVPFDAHASQPERNSDTSGAWTCAKLAVIGVGVTGFWVFTFFIIIPALFAK